MVVHPSSPLSCRSRAARAIRWWVLALPPFLAACDPAGTAGISPPKEDDDETFCAVPTSDLVPILGPDQILALTDPVLVGPDDPGAEPWDDDHRVVGLMLDGEALAVPLGILRHHEIVNLNRGDRRVSVTYCPLTGSALTFDRSAVDGAELGVSGILHRNNLLMFDRGAAERSFFGQMARRALCGPLARTGRRLGMVPSWEIRWDAWRALHPETRVVTFQTGYARSYDVNSNAEYEELDNPDRLQAVALDPRRPPKERVLGVPVGGDGGHAFPFEAMRSHARLVGSLFRRGRPVVVFWDGAAEAATAFYADLDDLEMEFRVEGSGYRDAASGTLWRLDGLGTEGPLTGRRLEPVAEAYVAFWFAWADVHPETVLRIP